MAKTPTDQPVNTLTWEDRYPSRYDDKATDVSEWRDVADSVKADSKKNGSPKSSSKSKK
jgi:hypothetical protein